jgi:hypothetical protein
MNTDPWLINTLLASYLSTSEILVLSLKLVVMDIMVCEVGQPLGMSWEFCAICSGCKKSCERN